MQSIMVAWVKHRLTGSSLTGRLSDRVRPRIVHLVDAPDCSKLHFAEANHSEDAENEVGLPIDVPIHIGGKAAREGSTSVRELTCFRRARHRSRRHAPAARTTPQRDPTFVAIAGR